MSLWRLRNRFKLAWWAFRNPDNLTMLRWELDIFANEPRNGPTALGMRAAWWRDRFLTFKVR